MRMHGIMGLNITDNNNNRTNVELSNGTETDNVLLFEAVRIKWILKHKLNWYN